MYTPAGTLVRDEVMQVPSNIVLIRLGPRVWLPIIIVSWGVVATLFAGLKSATDFYVLRLLLGVAESGSFPGISSHQIQIQERAHVECCDGCKDAASYSRECALLLRSNAAVDSASFAMQSDTTPLGLTPLPCTVLRDSFSTSAHR